MKIKVEEIQNLTEEEIVIKCKKQDQRVSELIATLRLFDKTIQVKKDGRNHIVTLQDIYYFDTTDDKVFCYTEKDVYEVSIRLYEIENALFNTNFLRISKYMVIDTSKIISFKAQLNGRMDAILKNGEKVEISRNYVPALKLKLGGVKNEKLY